MVIPKSLQDFFQQQKARYAELFWYQEQDGKIILMIEKLALIAREILIKENIKDIFASASGWEIVSFETDDSVGEFYSVEAEQIDVETRPDKQEYQSITDKDLNSAFTDQTNDIYQDQLVKIFQPRGYESFCVVVFHSFAEKAPNQIGWIKNLEGVRKISKKEFLVPEKFSTFEEACKKFEGVKYQLGGGSFKNGFDCSSLAQRVFYETKGIWLPRKARWQALVCDPIKQSELQQGDLVFFAKKDKPAQIDHVALVYITQLGKLPVVFHAKKLNSKVEAEDLNGASWLNQPTHSGDWEINGFGRVRG